MPAKSFGVAHFYKAITVATGVFCLGVLMFFVYAYAEKQIDQENIRLVQAIQLGDELRQSSDDLSRMARAYVVTGDELFREHYFEILEIRNGQRPRPENYQDVYWDLVLSDDKRPRPMEAPLAMVEQVRRIGLTPAEMVKLSTAKNYSDQLVSTELTAMGRMAGGSKPGSAAHVAAIELLHNAAYHEAKARVMQPLAELNEMLRSRAQSRVDAAVQISFYLRLGLIAMAVIEMACLWWVYRSLNRILGSSLRELRDYIVRLGADPLVTPPQAPPYKDSIVDWLAQMQVRLNVLHHRHEQNEEILRQRTEELEARNQELRRLNRKDALTGLQNRLSADERLVQEFNRFKRNADPAQGYAVLFADIDHFKHVNDTYGHDIGDRVLCQLGLVLEASLRQTDYLARFGGEEFLILLPDTEIEGATTLAEKIRVAVMAHSFPVDGQLTISIGVTLVSVQDSSDTDALHRADVALYRAKNGGRNRVEVVLA